MKNTIGKKVLLILCTLGIILLLIVLSNVSALSIINGYNEDLNNNIDSFVEAAKRANRHLSQIVEKLREDKGDLTERIKVESKDEVGQLVIGINGFIEHLQRVIQILQINTDKILNATDDINHQVKESRENAVTVSDTAEQLSASMQEIAATLDEIVIGSKDILKEVQNMSTTADNGPRWLKTLNTVLRICMMKL